MQRQKLIAIVLFVCFFIASTDSLANVSATSFSSNYVPNSDFESGSYYPWDFGGWSSYFSISSTVKYNGTYSLQCWNDQTGWVSGFVNTAPVSVNKTVYFKAAIRNNASEPTIGITELGIDLTSGANNKLILYTVADRLAIPNMDINTTDVLNLLVSSASNAFVPISRNLTIDATIAGWDISSYHITDIWFAVSGYSGVGHWNNAYIDTLYLGYHRLQVSNLQPLNGTVFSPYVSPTLSWTTPTRSFNVNVTGYYIQVYSDISSPFVSTWIGNETFYILTLNGTSIQTIYWRIRPKDTDGNGSWSASAYFNVIVLQTVYLNVYDANMANPESWNMANFHIYWRTPISHQFWSRALPLHDPIVSMGTLETVNITIQDLLGNTVLPNTQYVYNTNNSIDIGINVYQVKVKSYGDNGFGAAVLHRVGTPASQGAQPLLGSTDIIMWYIYSGSYRLDVYYSFVVKNHIQYPLRAWINKTYDITVANYPLYCAGFLVANASTHNIIDVLNTQEQGLTDIQVSVDGVSDTVDGLRTKLGDVQGKTQALSNNSNILNYIMTAFGIAVAASLVAIYARTGTKQNQEDLDHYRGVVNATDRQVAILRVEEEKRNQGGGGNG